MSTKKQFLKDTNENTSKSFIYKQKHGISAIEKEKITLKKINSINILHKIQLIFHTIYEASSPYQSGKCLNSAISCFQY